MPNTLQNAASKTMGAVKDAKATLKGLTGVFKHLMEEHGKVGALLKRVKASSDEKVRAELWPTIRTELLAHERGEVDAVYSVLAQYPETSNIVTVHSREARELQEAIGAVDALSFGDDAWQPTFERLVELVLKHVDEEESEFFPKAQKIIGRSRAQTLLPEFEAAKHI
jgi:hypothetical protein